MSRIIAIDGPSGSGKSSVSREVGRRLGFLHVDSGALYRIVTYMLLERGVDTSCAKDVADAAAQCIIEPRVENGSVAFYVGTLRPGDELRTPQVNANASPVAAVKEVRDKITALLKSLVSFGDLIVEGRDITSAVFPDSPARFYLTASPEARAARRRKEEIEKGIAAQSEEEVKASLLMRDKIDSTRRHAPLIKADGVIEIDSSCMSLEEVVEKTIEMLPAGWLKAKQA